MEHGYKKAVPPITTVGFTIVPVPVSVSITLKKVVDLEEIKHKIDFSFTITLEWSDNRVRYLNLKKESALNKLSGDDVNRLWLPYIIYKNTDNTETTRLGDNWVTDVLVNRTYNLDPYMNDELLKGWFVGSMERQPKDDFIRSGLEVVDETEIFHGATNTLIMKQTYTHSFQCKYQLQNYPFDTQVQLQIV